MEVHAQGWREGVMWTGHVAWWLALSCSLVIPGLSTIIKYTDRVLVKCYGHTTGVQHEKPSNHISRWWWYSW